MDEVDKLTCVALFSPHQKSTGLVELLLIDINQEDN